MTIEEILELEKQMVLRVDKKFANFYANACCQCELSVDAIYKK